MPENENKCYNLKEVEIEKVDSEKPIDMKELPLEKQVDLLDSEGEVLSFLKDFYIEEYEKETGDTSLTTYNIQIKSTHQNYVYVNEQTGEIITHGATPAVTEQKLQEQGINNSAIMYDVLVYQIEKVEGANLGFIDCGTLIEGKLCPTKLGDDFINGNRYAEVLIKEKFSPIILKGFECMKMINKEHSEYVDKMTNKIKKEMIELIEQYQESSEKQSETTKMKEEKEDEWGLE